MSNGRKEEGMVGREEMNEWKDKKDGMMGGREREKKEERNTERKEGRKA